MRPIFAANYSWMCGLALANCPLIRGYSFRENCLSLWQQLIIAIHSLVKDEVCIEILSTSGILSGLGLHRFCACCDNCCEFACTASLVGVENSLFQATHPSSSHPLIDGSSCLGSWGATYMFPLGLTIGQLWASEQITIHWK